MMLLAQALKVGYTTMWLICPINARPTKPYEYALYLPVGTTTTIDAVLPDQSITRCVYITRKPEA